MTRPPTPHPPTTHPDGRGPSALIWRWWNLLLLLPLLMLITPWFNQDRPRVLGLPFFYWYQLAFVFVGVACVWIVYAATRKAPSTRPKPAASSPDDPATGRPDDGARR
ncbi:hypothetical protein ABIB25_002277 [Nakamurella sp. UYEF19]|uniref:DUF3311 domain-containing protein n=1 Tax=Nakamurella sp. UYEF19 TaxID=1756392 RepID=UPI00339593C3